MSFLTVIVYSSQHSVEVESVVNLHTLTPPTKASEKILYAVCLVTVMAVSLYGWPSLSVSKLWYSSYNNNSVCGPAHIPATRPYSFPPMCGVHVREHTYCGLSRRAITSDMGANHGCNWSAIHSEMKQLTGLSHEWRRCLFRLLVSVRGNRDVSMKPPAELLS